MNRWDELVAQGRKVMAKAMREVKEPGKKGGKGYRTKSGKWRYGQKGPQGAGEAVRREHGRGTSVHAHGSYGETGGTTLRTPTRVVRIVMKHPKSGVDWSSDFIGNASSSELRRDPKGSHDYVCSDLEADWWVDMCARQQEADEALSSLSEEDRDEVNQQIRGIEFGDMPDAIMAAVEDLKKT